jgi:Fic family protein
MLGTKSIKITPDILARACAVDEFKGTWDGLQNFTTGLNVIKDVAKYGANFKRLFDPLKEQSITPDLILTAHAPPKKGMPLAGYKTEANQLIIMKDGVAVGTLETAAPEDCEALMIKLVDWLNKSLDEKEFHPLLTIAIFTSIFLQISPFENHNMRTARFLILLLMLKSGYSYAPYVPLDSIMNSKAELIYSALEHTQLSLESGKPDWSVWLQCFFMILQEQKDVLNARLHAKESVTAELPPLSAKVIKLFETKDRIQMKELVKLTNGRRSTLKLRLGELVDDGYLKRHGTKRSTWYSRV